MSDESDTNEFCDTPDEILITAKSDTLDLLPAKSRKQYEFVYKRFEEWCQKNDKQEVTEAVLLSYFYEKSESHKPSSLWAEYSMLKATLAINDNLVIKNFSKLTDFLKCKSVGYRPKKSKIFTKEQFYKFLTVAPDEKYLMMKVIAIFGIAGACRRDELQKMTVDDVEYLGPVLKIKIPDSKTNKPRSFVVSGEAGELNMVNICCKYMALRPAHTEHARFFVNYRNGKCSAQVVGVNSFAKIPNEIAKYLNLENPSEYTGHCFRLSSATLLADTGANVLSLRGCSDLNASMMTAEAVENSQNMVNNANQFIVEGMMKQTWDHEQQITPYTTVKIWNTEAVSELIKVYRRQPCLYDTSSVYYHNRELNRQALNEMVAVVSKYHPGVTSDDCRKKYQSLRNQFLKEHFKIEEARQNGHEYYSPKLWCFDALSFLKENLSRKNGTPIEYNSESQDCDGDDEIEEEEEIEMKYFVDNSSSLSVEAMEVKHTAEDNTEVDRMRENMLPAPQKREYPFSQTYVEPKARSVEREASPTVNTSVSSILDKRNEDFPRDKYDVFGEFVACSLRDMNKKRRKQLKHDILRLIMSAEIESDTE